MAAQYHKQDDNCEDFRMEGMVYPAWLDLCICGDDPRSIQDPHRLGLQRSFYKTLYRIVDPMMSQFPVYRKGTIVICLLALLVLVLAAGGCTQPAPQQQQNAPAPVTVIQTDNSHIMIAYPGSTETSTLLELEVTVTDSAGKTKTQSIGDRHSTTPLKFGATLPFTGTFNGIDHVLVTGYFLDGSHNLVLDTTM